MAACRIFSFCCGPWDLVPWPGLNPGPLPWEHGVLATGPPGKSLLPPSYSKILLISCYFPDPCWFRWISSVDERLWPPFLHQKWQWLPHLTGQLGYHEYLFISECPRHNCNILLKVLAPSSLLYSSDQPGNPSRISINLFAVGSSSSSLTRVGIVLYHLISIAFTTGPRSC